MNWLQTAWNKSFYKKEYRIGLHAIFWFIFFTLLEGIDYYVITATSTKWHAHFSDLLISFIGDALLITITYYLTILLSYKNIIIRRKYLRGLYFMVACIVIYVHLFYFFEWQAISLAQRTGRSLSPYSETLAPYVSKGYFYFIKIPILLFQISISYFFYMFLPVCCKFLRDQLRMQHKQSELQKKNIQLEMDFLKAQVHPHFLFNTLNNIYSLINYRENDKARDMVAGLSSLLRYALYDGKSEFIPLEKEVGMVKNFITLEEVRTDDLHIELKSPDHIPDIKIPPFLLLPIVENAFKHGANSKLTSPCIKIELDILDHHLWLQVKNNFDGEYRKANSGGLGLLNMRKRLDYYYPGSYFFETSENKDVYTATLKLPVTCPILNA